MNIGMSIQQQALQSNLSDEQKRVYIAGFPSLEMYIDYLQSLGVTSIEVRIYDQAACYDDFQEVLSIIQNKGLNITVHGELLKTVVGSQVRTDYPSLLPLLANLNKPIMMPIHASQGYEEGVDYAARTTQILQAWANELNANTKQIQFAVENNRVKKVNDPGNTIRGILEIVETLDREDVGICFDMGHYYSNIQHGKEDAPFVLEEDPLLNVFCKRVVHTHIHGINSEGTTHFPIWKDSDLLLHSFVQLLEQNNYKGIYNLELSLERWSKADDPKQYIAESIEYLQQTIALCRKGIR
ncbi:sugar phosphate isomerase/epimerase family protein [Alkalihalobacillus sp. 1P02AB]|uniref:sugar phosphate isomerase/epimerase family protein n=1 Tax=Alkalihalobacillus sp. 1P02AB TaxID=3132260 RepID=UPI0039A405B9